ncbi:hypothetical protein NQ318_000906 [Aromia moschata]|uniref:Uncharacterized protein n=1 Tax=Aromia moschata TaxID=1265417 RepID=A0AAV8ZF17_9CUCU|nr:hypothetical protein NQ318_000906 [Aromia moschata]
MDYDTVNTGTDQYRNAYLVPYKVLRRLTRHFLLGVYKTDWFGAFHFVSSSGPYIFLYYLFLKILFLIANEGKTERTSTDKKRERRKKKQKQRVHAIEKQKREENINNNGLGSKFNKEKAKRMLQQVTKDRNTGKMVESTTTKSVKSSKAFFTHLQEEVQTHIANKAGGKKKSKRQETFGRQKNEIVTSLMH